VVELIEVEGVEPGVEHSQDVLIEFRCHARRVIEAKTITAGS
jgi:hypothetical protein